MFLGLAFSGTVLWELTFWGDECLLGTGFYEGSNSFFLGCWDLGGGLVCFFFFVDFLFLEGRAFYWVGIPSITLQHVSLQDGDSHHAPPGQETCPGCLQWVSFGVLSVRGDTSKTLCVPPLCSHPILAVAF